MCEVIFVETTPITTVTVLVIIIAISRQNKKKKRKTPPMSQFHDSPHQIAAQQ